MRNWKSICGLLFVAAMLQAQQQGTVAGPSAGFVFDHSHHVLRGIRGIPGASLIGDSVDFGFQPAWVSVAPSLDSALAGDAQGSVHLFQLNGTKAVEFRIDGLVAGQQTIFSPSGSAAALFGSGSVQLLKGLPGAPAISGTLPLSGDFSSQIGAAAVRGSRRSTGAPLAVSDDGAYVLLASGGGIRILGVGGDNRQLTAATAGTLAAFAPGNHDVAVVDPENGLSLVQDAAGASVSKPLASPGGLPEAVAFSPDGQMIFVASAAAKNVAAFAIASGTSTTLACDCTPAGLIRMGDVFRLNEFGNGPIWLLDAKAGDPRLVFVPAMQ